MKRALRRCALDGRQQDDGVVHRGRVGVVGARAAAGLGIQVDEQVAVGVPVGPAPGQAQAPGVPGGVELLAAVEGGTLLGFVADAVVGADEGTAAVHPAVVDTPGLPPRPPNTGGSEFDVVGGEGAVYVDWAEGLPAMVAQGVLAGELDVEFLRLAGHVLRIACRVWREALPGFSCLGDAAGLRHPIDQVTGQAAAVATGGPGEGQGGRDLAQGQAGGDHTSGAGQRERDGCGRSHINHDGFADRRGAPGNICRRGNEGVAQAVGWTVEVGVPGIGPDVAVHRGCLLLAVCHSPFDAGDAARICNQAGHIQLPGERIVRAGENGRGGDADGRRRGVHNHRGAVGRGADEPVTGSKRKMVFAFVWRRPGNSKGGIGSASAAPGLGVERGAVG